MAGFPAGALCRTIRPNVRPTRKGRPIVTP
jgi:hypothetical protein